MKKITLTLCTLLLLTSCVSSKKYNALSRENADCSNALSLEKIKNSEYETKINSLNSQLEKANTELATKSEALTKCENESLSLKQENSELNKQLKTSNSKINEVLNDKSRHLTELNNTLSQKEAELNQKERTLDSLNAVFGENQKQLSQLKEQLKNKEEQLSSIHKRLKDALLGFADKGLTVETKDGKVYVSMDEKLLFASGSWQVSSEGMQALGEIAAVLSNSPDIDIMVEGHTDNVPLKGKNQIKDNWDLSVMRATSITKILLNNTGIDPKRIIPCGRGEYVPLVKNDSPEHKAKNRRSEIILSPKVDQLMDILK